MKAYVLGAGFVCISLAIFIQGILPIAIPESRETRATRAVRTELGDVKWVWYESSPYTPLEQLGRTVYQREGCWSCHSQYVRPVTGEDIRWGPVSQVGEYAHDWPHLLSTRRIGPDLTRVGLKYGDAWHYAHHWVPTAVVPDSIMPSFRWLYRTAEVAVVEKDGEVALADSAALRGLFTGKADRKLPLHPSPERLAFSRETDGTPVLDVKNLPEPYYKLDAWNGKTLTVIVPTEELRGLVAYIQKLGTNRGAWRDVFEPQTLSASVMAIPRTQEQEARGKEVYERRCVGCHGQNGDGNGPVATFLDPRPRDFRLGAFKFRTTPSGSLPTDGDLYRT
ncbi:MAG: cbb3-type cytochrome c oxidase subunit II, partial [Candidatus Rokuibacteriota bacterium]